jgi:hypothetical protein
MLTEAERATSRPAVDSADAGIGRAAVKGAIVGFFAVLTIVGSLVFLTGAGLGIALTVGTYAAIWGGPGWGGMMAAQKYADRLAEDERRATRR